MCQCKEAGKSQELTSFTAASSCPSCTSIRAAFDEAKMEPAGHRNTSHNQLRTSVLGHDTAATTWLRSGQVHHTTTTYDDVTTMQNHLHLLHLN
jgi:hypothetical protein